MLYKIFWANARKRTQELKPLIMMTNSPTMSQEQYFLKSFYAPEESQSLFTLTKLKPLLTPELEESRDRTNTLIRECLAEKSRR